MEYPAEIAHLICAHVFSAGYTPRNNVTSLDPLIFSPHAPGALPDSTVNWSEPVARATLANLCLVTHTWNEAARPLLWSQVLVRLPRTWLALVEEVAVSGEDTMEQAAVAVDKSIKAAAIAASTFDFGSEKTAFNWEQSILESLHGVDGSIPPELLSPLPSREPSPRRIRTKSKSPARWKIMRSISDAVVDIIQRKQPGAYVPTPQAHAARFVQHLDFNHFRTIGMRRSVEEGVSSRFVTGERVTAVLKEMPNLRAFGATEYMDGALTLNVLQEIFLRGAPSRGRGPRASRGRELTTDNSEEDDRDDRERRRDCSDLEAVDLTGCVSAVFVNALTEFVHKHLVPPPPESESEDEEASTRRRIVRIAPVAPEALSITGLQRLGLRGVKSIIPSVLSPLVMCFPNLTHLDLSCTRVDADLLTSLGESTTVKLHSLALARCIMLTGDSIRDFLVDSPVSSQIRELSLYGDLTFPSPLSKDNLADIFSEAPSFTSGKLVYLDLSSAPLTREILLEIAKPQPALRSLGLSYIPSLDLKLISEFIKTKAANIEILTLVNTSPELSIGAVPGSARTASVSLHTHLIRPLCTPPFSFSVTAPTAPPAPPPTRLRVIELATPMLTALGAGAGSWRIIRSKGGRGWYVDVASGWVAGVLRRDLSKEAETRMGLERLSEANGNVSSGVGWHARKMEVLHGNGMLGREDGLYGAVSFAYQG